MTGAMTRLRLFRPLLSRLLLSLAIVTCVLGLSESAMASSPPIGTGAVAGIEDDAGHPSHQHSGFTAAAATQAAPTPTDGHAGHGDGDGMHAVGCMVAVGVAAIAFLLVLGLLGVARGAESGRRLRGRARAGLQPRPPSLTTLCIQRV